MKSLNTNNDAVAIRRQMSELRSHLNEEIEDVATHARDLVDYKHYVSQAPWLAFAGAVLAGYVVVPSRQPTVSVDAEQLEQIAKRQQYVVAPQKDLASRPTLSGTLFRMVATAAVRAGVGFASQKIAQLSAKNLPMPSPHPMRREKAK